MIPFAPDADGPGPSSWSPVAMATPFERHDSPSQSREFAGGAAPAVARAESHDPDAVRALDKAARLADEIATLAAARARATAQGAAAASVARDGQVYASPTVGRLTSAAGPRWGTTHYGLDIANRIGTPIFAVADGTVVESGPASGFGLWVRIRHSDGTTSVYGHIDRSLVGEGQQVRAGDRIALMGNRGQSTGPHLHLEIWSAAGAKVDPQSWLTRRGIPVR
ncbi:M23 family metallopeptidase [Pseudonocardia sp. RS010]|uniref:M23 family metallopeptidase n=1 Tax=Pseudonocardia sp. RS010 TaxID=3385979 RepID=UPI00399F2180